ncbi:LytR/AlgR family response regulator transcription factor [Flavilitoribacter nigricans]|uniref:DNA-binding response regulator n=1 Tax=Flavilitoribacter nigricans (strain ATCC 23147 / DSM 23189 / NBRC 102662 / NCIMB 1420 / SS-2) TaxID=1122177 RepID=A0A2D0NAW5_FLAN2|nr:LytTR family DNA-binding domain-containing protein [Flavilitoribacter nigricans]PHN05536.1 DNA-binding response regulator [Flavilitoribacter nigricans DSM 23189 = NBRC 102662]
MTSIIVEDSRLARQELRNLLEKHAEIEVVGEASHAEEARQLIESLEPDLLFLDIQLPGKNGFDLLEMLETSPMVVFTTAFDEYAVKSFEYNTLDYLLKPIRPERLAATVERLLERWNQQDHPERGLMQAHSQVFVRDGESCWLVRLSEVRLMEVVGNYTRLYFEDNRPLIQRSLNQLESRLDPQLFFRANRQQMINLQWIEHIDTWFNGKLRIRLRGGEEVEVSRRQAAKFKDILSL